MGKKLFAQLNSLLIVVLFLLASHTFSAAPVLATIYDHFDNGFQVGTGNLWLGFVDLPNSTGSFNGDGILSVSGSFLNVAVPPQVPGSPPPTVLNAGYTGGLKSPAFSDDFSVRMQFSGFSVSSGYYTYTPFKNPNFGLNVSYAPGYAIRVARFQIPFFNQQGQLDHTEDWFVVIRSAGLTPEGPGPVNNVFWQPMLRAFENSGEMGLVRNGSIVETWASDGPGGAWTKLYTFNLVEYSAPLNIGIGAQAYSIGGAFSVRSDWIDKSPVPVPPSVWLLGAGLSGLAGIRRKVKK